MITENAITLASTNAINLYERTYDGGRHRGWMLRAKNL
jgi:hypothetical protein